MTRTEAFELLQGYYDRRVFGVRIGVCSPQIEDVDFETALAEFDRCAKFDTSFMEYVYIYAFEGLKDADRLNEALVLFNLGCGRHRLNQGGPVRLSDIAD